MIATPGLTVTETLTTRVVDGLRILQVAGRVLVASRSEDGRWYDVTDGACGCKGYEHRGRCAHLTATAELFKPVEPICILCHKPAPKLTKYAECIPCVRGYMFPEGA